MDSNISDDNHENAAIITALGMMPGLGNTRINRILQAARQQNMELLELFGPGGAAFIKAALEAGAGDWPMRSGMDASLLKEARNLIVSAVQKHILPITLWDKNYPKSFKYHLGVAAPPLLFVQGNQNLFASSSGAVVGTRMPSEKGRKAARDAAHAIASHGAIVVSGGAVGVDWAAHDAMVLSGRQTLVILPQGIATYPLPGRWRYAREEGRLLLVSPYLPNAPWRTHAAVSRNALISSQAQLVCVIEPRSQGGSILTTRHAVNQQKAVFAEPLSSLPASLRPHAQPLSGFRDALSSYTWESPELLPNDRQPDLF